MTLIGKVIFLLIKAGKPEFDLVYSIKFLQSMPQHNEDFFNAEQEEKNKRMGVRI